VSSEQIFLLLTAAAAALVGAAALVAVLRERRRTPDGAPSAGLVASDATPAAEQAGWTAEDRGTAYNGVLRILWWLTIAVVMVGVGVSGAYGDVQPQIFALGGGAVIAVIAFHELFPSARRRPAVAIAEALVALGLVTGLLVLTGYGASPFFFAYAIVAVAAALAHGGRVALIVGALATLGYLGVLAVDPQRGAWTPLDGLRFGLNIGSVWLLAYLAGVFAAQERRVRRRMVTLTRTDPLTGLFNRAHLLPTLEQEVSRTRRSDRGFCLLMVDLDGLKAVNDTFGHHRGDEVLRAIGRIIHRSIRTVDAAYRYGGDEFLILLPETDIPGAFVVAEKIRTGAEEVGLALTGTDGTTSVSIGLVSHPEDGSTAEELMLAADRAMYQAKSLGKNQISGNPRPRRLIGRVLPPASEPPVEPPSAPIELPPVAPPAAEAPDATPVAATTPIAVGAAAHNGGPTVNLPIEPEAEQVPVAMGGDEEPDAAVVRGQIATARLSFDPDDQIRRAMDAFLSAPRDPSRGPDA
jgi:diguanylate cyclase (GGDEF)-like protein